LSFTEGIGSYSQNPTITNWFFIDQNQLMQNLYVRERPDWFDHAKCLGVNASSPTNLFYAEGQQNNAQVQAAKAVCNGTHPEHPGRCPVLEECLDYAIENSERFGVWGGCSERERRRIKRQRHREEALEAGDIIPLSPGDQQKSEEPSRYDEAGQSAPWRYSAPLVAAWRRERATKRRSSPVSNFAL